MNEWVTIFDTDQTYLAGIVKDLLYENGIEAVILDQQDSSFKIGTIHVMVKEDQQQKAAEILKTIDRE